IRRVKLRGIKIEKLEGEDYSPDEQLMYLNNFGEDLFLQFIYERMLLLKELLKNEGCIFVRFDYHFSHYIKIILDEVFGKENFVNEISVNRTKKIFEGVRGLNVAFDSLFVYTKNTDTKLKNVYKSRPKVKWLPMHSPGVRHPRERIVFDTTFIPPEGRHWTFVQERIDNELLPEGRIRVSPNDQNILEYLQSENELLDTNWSDIPGNTTDWSDIPGYTSNNTGYPTENSEKLLERIINMGSIKNDIVLDCFSGSGTTPVVAQKLGRRWIACDINKGSIQITSKRLQETIEKQYSNDKQLKLGEDINRYYSFGIYKINNYDLQILRTEAIELAIKHIGIKRTKTDIFFDGILGNNIVKIIDFNHPLTLIDLQVIQEELKKRPEENRNITIVCLGRELAVESWIKDYNNKHYVNKFEVIELRTDSRYGRFLIHTPAYADVRIERKGNKALIKIRDYISPTIIERLNQNSRIFKVEIPDFRAMIDLILIDSDHNEKLFNICYSDIPKKKDDYVKAEYIMSIPKRETIIAVKIIDMLGEEVLIKKRV
ncbi:MAG: site-specific DNA-methyltransferase, partial [Candidatus Methanofastidiosa archaeon]|nr:site-specific DNA-methyltransferase [Candidatus Methanofastidiosa archaeon]